MLRGELGDGAGSGLFGSLGRFFQDGALLLELLRASRVLRAIHLRLPELGLRLGDPLLEVSQLGSRFLRGGLVPIHRELQLTPEPLLLLDDGVQLSRRLVRHVPRVHRLLLLLSQVVVHRQARLVERNLQLVVLFLSSLKRVGEGFSLPNRRVSLPKSLEPRAPRADASLGEHRNPRAERQVLAPERVDAAKHRFRHRDAHVDEGSKRGEVRVELVHSPFSLHRRALVLRRGRLRLDERAGEPLRLLRELRELPVRLGGRRLGFRGCGRRLLGSRRPRIRLGGGGKGAFLRGVEARLEFRRAFVRRRELSRGVRRDDRPFLRLRILRGAPEFLRLRRQASRVSLGGGGGFAKLRRARLSRRQLTPQRCQLGDGRVRGGVGVRGGFPRGRQLRRRRRPLVHHRVNPRGELLRRPRPASLRGERDFVRGERARVRAVDLAVRARISLRPGHRRRVLRRVRRVARDPVVQRFPRRRRQPRGREGFEIRHRGRVVRVRSRLRGVRSRDGAVQRREHRRERPAELALPSLRRRHLGVDLLGAVVEKVDQVLGLLGVRGEVFARRVDGVVRRALRQKPRGRELVLEGLDAFSGVRQSVFVRLGLLPSGGVFFANREQLLVELRDGVLVVGASAERVRHRRSQLADALGFDLHVGVGRVRADLVRRRRRLRVFGSAQRAFAFVPCRVRVPLHRRRLRLRRRERRLQIRHLRLERGDDGGELLRGRDDGGGGGFLGDDFVGGARRRRRRVSLPPTRSVERRRRLRSLRLRLGLRLPRGARQQLSLGRARLCSRRLRLRSLDAGFGVFPRRLRRGLGPVARLHRRRREVVRVFRRFLCRFVRHRERRQLLRESFAFLCRFHVRVA